MSRVMCKLHANREHAIAGAREYAIREGDGSARALLYDVGMSLARVSVLLCFGSLALVACAERKSSSEAPSAVAPATPATPPPPLGQPNVDPPTPAPKPQTITAPTAPPLELRVTAGPAPKSAPTDKNEKKSLEAHSTGVALSPEIIHRVVQQSYPRFHACYESGLRQNPTLQGRMTVKLVIAADGATRSASVTTTDLPDKTVATCVTKAFSALSFPPPDHGELTVSYPVAFSPSDAAPN